MKNKIIAICISVLVCIAFIVPASIFGEGNAADGNSQPAVENNEQIEDNTTSEQTSEPVNTNGDNGVMSETESSVNGNTQDEEAEENTVEPQMTNSPQQAPAGETEWDKLKKNVESAGLNGKSGTVTTDKDVSADATKDNGKTIEIKSGQNVIIKGAHSIKGIGYSSFKIDKGGSLTIEGPSISNAQIIAEGKLNLNSGKISETKLEGPTIFVNSGTFTMNGGEVSGNEAIESSTPKPAGLKKIGDFYQYSPITVYSGTFTLNAGTISSNKSFLKGGAIGAWGTESSRAKLVIEGGEITGNKAEHSSKYAWGGSIYTLNSNFEMTAGIISKNVAEKGGGIAAQKSNMTFTGGNITDNTNNGDFLGEGGGILAYDTNINIKNINISNNTANGDGGGISINGLYDKPNINIESGIFKGNSASKDSGASGGVLLVRNCTYKIDGGTFTENFAKYMGGAICFTDKSDGIITAGLFTKNTATGKWGGGAILNDHTCKLVIKRALVKDNKIKEGYMIGAGNHPASKQGGGIFNCPTGNTEIYITNGLALYDNSAPNLEGYPDNNGAGDDFINITTYSFNEPKSKPSQVKLASRMLGGGYRLWYQDGSFYNHWINWPKSQQTPRYDPKNPGNPLPYNTVIQEKKGAQLAYKSVPKNESKALAEQVATTIISDNSAYAAELSGGGKCGGGIANNGELEFGEDNPYTLKIMKSWTGDKKKDRPKEIKLQMFVGEHYVQDITLKESENWTTEIKDFPDPDTLKDNKTNEILPINFKEKDGDKYLLSVLSREKDSQNLIYKIQLDNSVNTSVKVTKKWIDNENKQGIRPDNITVGLLANGKDTGRTIVLSENTNWKGEFEKLPMYENDEIVKYEVKEISKIKGYTSKIEGNSSEGYIITNKIIPPNPPKPPTSDSNNLSAFVIMLIAAVILLIHAHVLRKKQNT